MKRKGGNVREETWNTDNRGVLNAWKSVAASGGNATNFLRPRINTNAHNLAMKWMIGPDPRAYRAPLSKPFSNYCRGKNSNFCYSNETPFDIPQYIARLRALFKNTSKSNGYSVVYRGMPRRYLDTLDSSPMSASTDIGVAYDFSRSKRRVIVAILVRPGTKFLRIGHAQKEVLLPPGELVTNANHTITLPPKTRCLVADLEHRCAWSVTNFIRRQRKEPSKRESAESFTVVPAVLVPDPAWQ